jgi:hypothetical protein
MKSIAIDPKTANFVRENGRLCYTKTDLEFLAQVIQHELSIFLGEWYMDTAKGLPYHPQGIKKSEHRTVLEMALRAKLVGIKGIKRVKSFIPHFDKRERLYEVVFIVETEVGLLKSSWDSNIPIEENI